MSIIKQIQNRRRQLDELSRKTLASYTDKAAHKLAAATADHALAVDARDRAKAKGNKKAAKYAGQNMTTAFKQHYKRTKGIYAATERLAKEEVEQVDEISKETLASYVHKANDQFDRAMDGKLTPAEAAKNKASKKKIGDKRIPGIELAVKKYHAKEEVEQIDELSKDAVKKYGRKA